MTTTLMKAFLIIFSINMILFIGGVRVIGEDNQDFLSNFIDINDSGGTQIIISEGFTETLPTSVQESGSQVLNFIDSIGAVRDFIFFMVNITFTPVGLFMSAGMPQAITLMLGIPLMLAAFLGMAYFIRSGT